MLRPQVFALYEGAAEDEPNPVQIGLIASERQAINACLRSLAAEDERFQPVADKYWAARGGSHTDGGAFRFTFRPEENGTGTLRAANKFEEDVRLAPGKRQARRSRLDSNRAGEDFQREWQARSQHAYDDGGAPALWRWLKPEIVNMGWDELAYAVDWLVNFGGYGEGEWEFARQSLDRLRDRRYDTGEKKRASLLALVDDGLRGLFACTPRLNGSSAGNRFRLEWGNRGELEPAPGETAVLVFDALGFPPEGTDSAANTMVRAVQLGWRALIVYNWRGGRFAACGFGPQSEAVRVELYGDVGDYATSGLDGPEVILHGDGQDQVGQILKSGRMVIHGDVGQTFLYGAKGGEIYVLGSAAGRPLINAVGKPRTVINGTCLDYLAESFMAGDPLEGGGFVILNGVAFDESGALVDLESPYPGGNLFSLASGGAIYLRDPWGVVTEDQLNGGAFAPLSDADWALIEPYLKENERLFEIRLGDLLTVNGTHRAPEEVYRKVVVSETGLLREKENR